MEFIQTAKDVIVSKEWPKPKLTCIIIWRPFAQHVWSYGSKCESTVRSRSHIRSSIKVTDLFNQQCICYCWISTRRLKMILLLDFAVAFDGLQRPKTNKQSNKKNLKKHGIHFNISIDRDSLMVRQTDRLTNHKKTTNYAIWFLDPQNMIVDIKIIIVTNYVGGVLCLSRTSAWL